MATPNLHNSAKPLDRLTTDRRRGHSQQGEGVLRQANLPLLTKLFYAGLVCALQGYVSPLAWLRTWKEYLYPAVDGPTTGGPDIVKAYECRQHLPVRIFFPATYDQTSPHMLPAVITIHGSDFCTGRNRDADTWNRKFADAQHCLLASLEYSKDPWAGFPSALMDLGDLALAVLNDESLPVDRVSRGRRNRTAIIGRGAAGGNLALAVAQLPCLRNHRAAPAAVISVCGALDLGIPAHEKSAHEPQLLRKAEQDLLKRLSGCLWAYVPYGHDLGDPLLSSGGPAVHDNMLPPFVCVVSTEVDALAHEGWRFACRMAREGAEMNKRGAQGPRDFVPDRPSVDMRDKVFGMLPEWSTQRVKRELELRDERFAWEEVWKGGGGVKWLFVPGVEHRFDEDAYGWAGDDLRKKSEGYLGEVGRWLREVVWEVGSDCVVGDGYEGRTGG